MDERKLIRGLRDGDFKSYEALFMAYYSRFVAFACNILKDRQAAEDIVQDAFIKVYINRATLDENRSIVNYILVIVKNAIINLLRSRRKFIQAPVEEVLAGINGTSDVEIEVEGRETSRTFADALAQMPPRRRDVIVMSKMDGMPNKDVARALDISLKTVDRHIAIAKADLKKVLKN